MLQDPKGMQEKPKVNPWFTCLELVQKDRGGNKRVKANWVSEMNEAASSPIICQAPSACPDVSARSDLNMIPFRQSLTREHHKH